MALTAALCHKEARLATSLPEKGRRHGVLSSRTIFSKVLAAECAALPKHVRLGNVVAKAHPRTMMMSCLLRPRAPISGRFRR